MFRLGLFLRPLYHAADPGDLLPPDPAPVPVPDPAPEPRPRLVCEFCECSLTPRGDVLKMSSKAKALRDHEDTIATQASTIADLKRELAAARAQIPPPAPAPKRGIFS